MRLQMVKQDQTVLLQQFFYKRNMKIFEDVAIPIDISSLELSESIINTTFDLLQNQNSKTSCRAFLFPNKIIIQLTTIQSHPQTKYYSITLEFELKTQLYEHSDTIQKSSNREQFNYIKLFKNQEKIVLRNPQPSAHFQMWKKSLQRSLVQIGFYERYTPINQIGEGNFAKIFLVQKQNDQEYMALKTFSKVDQFQMQKGKKSFINEIGIMRKFDHPNLLKMGDVYENQHSLFICMELLSGGNLMDKINDKVKFSSLQLKAIIKSLLLGLQEMHRRKIMHRDLKPQNILFRHHSPNECVIADFGLAEEVNTESRIFNICGTFGYVAPEILNLTKESTYDQACDIFSLGVIFHLMVIGKLPFFGRNRDELYQSNKECEINFQDFEYHQLPSTWLKFMKQLLQVDPKKRLTATEALDHSFFKKEPLVKKNSNKSNKSKKSEEQYCPFDIENKINILEFDQILIKRKSNLLKKIQNSQKKHSKQNVRSEDTIKSSGKSAISINSPLKNLKKTKVEESKFRNIAMNNS